MELVGRTTMRVKRSLEDGCVLKGIGIDSLDFSFGQVVILCPMRIFVPRKAFEPGGIAFLLNDGCDPLPPNAAGRECSAVGQYRYVTWDEVMQERRERQSEHLERKLGPVTAIRAVRVMCWLNQRFPFEGWHCVIDGCPGSLIHEWANRYSRGDVKEMQSVLPVPGAPATMQEWMPLFAEHYPDLRRLPHREGERQYPRGVAYIWAVCRGGSIDKLLPVK